MKKQISSDVTIVWKYIFPGLWIPFMGTAVVFIGLKAATEPRWGLYVLAWIAFSGYLTWFARRLKYVSIDDDFLYVSQARKEIRIPLTHIVHVKENFWANPKLITITLDQPSEFGTKIVFVPTSLVFAGLRSHPIVKEIKRAVQHRRSGL